MRSWDRPRKMVGAKMRRSMRDHNQTLESVRAEAMRVEKSAQDLAGKPRQRFTSKAMTWIQGNANLHNPFRGSRRRSARPGRRCRSDWHFYPRVVSGGAVAVELIAPELDQLQQFAVVPIGLCFDSGNHLEGEVLLTVPVPIGLQSGVTVLFAIQCGPVVVQNNLDVQITGNMSPAGDAVAYRIRACVGRWKQCGLQSSGSRSNRDVRLPASKLALQNQMWRIDAPSRGKERQHFMAGLVQHRRLQ